MAYRVLDEGVPMTEALKEAKEVGMRTQAYEAKAVEYIKKHQSK